MRKRSLWLAQGVVCVAATALLQAVAQPLGGAQTVEANLQANEAQLREAEKQLRRAQERLAEAQLRLRAQEEQLQLQNENLQLQETELQLKKNVNRLEQKQLGISDTTKPIGFGGIRAGTEFQQLPEVPIESKILVFKSSGEVAQLIAHDVEQVAKDSSISSLVVYSQREFAKVNGYRLYNSMRQGIVTAYQDLGVELPQVTSEGGARSVGVGDVLPTSTTVLKSVAELFSYFRSEDKIALNNFTPQGEKFIVAQLVSELRRRQSKIQVYAPSVYLMDFSRANGVFETFLGELNELAALKSEAVRMLVTVSDPQKQKRLEELNSQADLLLNLLKDTNFQGSENQEGDGPRSGAQIFQLIKGAEINQLLNSRKKRVLVLDVLASGGSTRTRRSLFTSMFSGQRVSYSGGIAVQYFLVNPDNSFAMGDVIYRNSGFKTMRGATQSRRR